MEYLHGSSGPPALLGAELVANDRDLATLTTPPTPEHTINSFQAAPETKPFRRYAVPAPPALPGASALRGHRRGAGLTPLVQACRPRQWSKNLLVLAAPCAAGVIGTPLVAAQVAGAFIAMCLLSSATYLLNDVRDREQDRLHPQKRARPIAAGTLSVASALTAAAVLALSGLLLASAIDLELGAVACAYLTLTVCYSLWLRHVVVADMLAIAAGFVLRALAGGVATDVYLSRWFVVVTGCAAVYLVAAKRYAELREHAGTAATRSTLRRYSARGLRLTLVGAASTASVAYCAWALTRPAHAWWFAFSLLPLVAWLARYAALVGAGAGQAPEELILRDRTLLVLTVSWTLLFLGGVYVAG